MMKFIYPKEQVTAIYAIDFEGLYGKGYRNVLFDVDNTLVPFDLMEAPHELVDFMGKLEKLGLHIGLVSNNSTSRVEALNQKLHLASLPNAMKPFTFRLKGFLRALSMAPEKSIFVGDQLFTDVWVGNSLGLYSILVKPIQKKEQVITRIKRGLESMVMKGYNK